jgi:hypothetical protein
MPAIGLGSSADGIDQYKQIFHAIKSEIDTAEM